MFLLVEPSLHLSLVTFLSTLVREREDQKVGSVMLGEKRDKEERKSFLKMEM